MESILTSIKKLLGIEESYTHFDDDIIMHINSVFSVLTQLGVGPSDGFMIEDDSETWDKFTSNKAKFNMVKTYMYKKVKLMFDPPTNAAAIDAINKEINELEWRLNVVAESKET